MDDDTHLLTFPLEASYSLFLPSIEFFNTHAAKREKMTKGSPACTKSCPDDGASSTTFVWIGFNVPGGCRFGSLLAADADVDADALSGLDENDIC